MKGGTVLLLALYMVAVFFVVVILAAIFVEGLRESAGYLVVAAFFLCLYLLPSAIAAFRNHPQLAAIFVCNLLLGLTVLGWVVSLIWAFVKQSQPSNTAST